MTPKRQNFFAIFEIWTFWPFLAKTGQNPTEIYMAGFLPPGPACA
jgi:hypothetical protein